MMNYVLFTMSCCCCCICQSDQKRRGKGEREKKKKRRKNENSFPSRQNSLEFLVISLGSRTEREERREKNVDDNNYWFCVFLKRKRIAKEKEGKKKKKKRKLVIASSDKQKCSHKHTHIRFTPLKNNIKQNLRSKNDKETSCETRDLSNTKRMRVYLNCLYMFNARRKKKLTNEEKIKCRHC